MMIPAISVPNNLGTKAVLRGMVALEHKPNNPIMGNNLRGIPLPNTSKDARLTWGKDTQRLLKAPFPHHKSTL